MALAHEVVSAGSLKITTRRSDEEQICRPASAWSSTNTKSQEIGGDVGSMSSIVRLAACVEIRQCVGCTDIATPSSRCRVDGVEVDAAIQDERAVNLISTQAGTPPLEGLLREHESPRTKPFVVTRATSIQLEDNVVVLLVVVVLNWLLCFWGDGFTPLPLRRPKPPATATASHSTLAPPLHACG